VRVCVRARQAESEAGGSRTDGSDSDSTTAEDGGCAICLRRLVSQCATQLRQIEEA
jgi:hypothetical protein